MAAYSAARSSGGTVAARVRAARPPAVAAARSLCPMITFACAIARTLVAGGTPTAALVTARLQCTPGARRVPRANQKSYRAWIGPSASAARSASMALHSNAASTLSNSSSSGVERRGLLLTAQALLAASTAHGSTQSRCRPTPLRGPRPRPAGRGRDPTHRLEQPVPTLGPAALGDHQRAANEVDQRRDDGGLGDAPSSVTTASMAPSDIEAGNTDSRWKMVRSTGSSRAAAPIEQRPHVLVAVEARAVSAVQHTEPIGESGVDLGRAEHVRLGSSELDGQREAVEAPAQRRQRDGVVVVDLERRLDGGGPVRRVGARRRRPRCVPSVSSVPGGGVVNGASGTTTSPVTPSGSPGLLSAPAGIGAETSSRCAKRGSVADDVLAVVENEHAAQRGTTVHDGGLEACARGLRAPRSTRRSPTPTIGASLVGVRSTNQTPSGTRSCDRSGHLDREAGLADAARAR